MNREIIFIGGIHGVGKTTLSHKISQEIGIDHFSAGKLISMLKEENENGRDKRVTSVDGNQEILISAIDHFIKGGSTCLLDGHFCLLNREGEVTEVPRATFEKISPIAIIILHDSVEEISKKIGDRDNKNYDVDLLSYFQSRELGYSRDIAAILQVPYLVFNMQNDVVELIGFIKELKNKGL